jgi:hypothetical protein
VFDDPSDVCLEDNLLSWCGTDDFSEPSEVGRPLGGPAFIADILAQQEGLQAVLGGLEILDGTLSGAGQVEDGLVLNLGDIDRREIPETHQPGELHGVASVRLDTVAWFLRDEQRGDHPAEEGLFGEMAVSPIPTGTGLIDQKKMLGLGLERAYQRIDVVLPCADGAQEDYLSSPLFPEHRPRRWTLGAHPD